MCGRYFIDDSPELRPIIEAMNRSPLASLFRQNAELVSHGEIRPTDTAPVIASSRSGNRAVFPMKWGFTGKTLLINAKTETAAIRPTFRDAWASHRCIVPASGYYEWEHLTAKDGKRKTGGKYALWPRGASVTWLCGLYRIEQGLPCYVILTREPCEGIRFLHDRMPLMLPDGYVDEWIRPDRDPAEVIKAAQTDIQYQKVSGRAANEADFGTLLS